MENRGSYLASSTMLNFVVDNKPYSVHPSDRDFAELRDLCKRGEWDKAVDLFDRTRGLKVYVEEKSEDSGRDYSSVIEINDHGLLYKGKELDNAIVDQIFEMRRNGDDIQPLINFLENLMENPSYRAVTELYGWMSASNMLSITPDGHFLAYKRIRDDYKDIWSGKMDNSIGKVVEMARNEVNEDPNQTCSAGLHFCSHSYLSSYGTGAGNRTVIVKINPRDVVSIPVDYNNAKGRCCRYEVVNEVDHKTEEVFTKPVDDTFDEGSQGYNDVSDDTVAEECVKKTLSDISYGSSSDRVDDECGIDVKVETSAGCPDRFEDCESTCSHVGPCCDSEECICDGNGNVVVETKVSSSASSLTKDAKARVLNNYTNAQLAEAYNSLPGVYQIKKFRDKRTAVMRTLPYFSQIINYFNA